MLEAEMGLIPEHQHQRAKMGVGRREGVSGLKTAGLCSELQASLDYLTNCNQRQPTNDLPTSNSSPASPGPSIYTPEIPPIT